MYLSEIHIRNFRCFDESDNIFKFNKGLNVLVGENDSGKSAIIDAIRIVLGTTDQGWYRIETTDFYKEDRSKEILIICRFSDLSTEECASFLECLTYIEEGNSRIPNLYLHWSCKYLHHFSPPRATVKLSTGINGDGPAPVAEARELLRVTYLRALRDAYSDMQSGRNSRLSHIIQNVPDLRSGKDIYTEDTDLGELSIIGIADLSNKLLAEHQSLKKANQKITEILKEKMLLHGDSIETQLQVAGMNVDESKKLVSLLEKLDLNIACSEDKNRGRVGLGTSNLMSMACELLLNNTNMQIGRSSFLLIEEPEAHLHAQRQLRLIQSLQEEEKTQQIILTTHSPLLASVVKLDNIIIVNKKKAYSMAKGYTLLDENDYLFLERYLDATKANLFFAKAVVIVEGPSEELLLPTIAKLLNRDFSKYGVSIVNVRGVGLRRFARIFQRKDETNLLTIPVACITDRDILPDGAPAICIDKKYTDKESFPARNKRKWVTESELTNSEKEKHLSELCNKADGQLVKTFVSNYWTFEYDLFYSGLQSEMLESLVRIKCDESNQEKKLTEITDKINKLSTPEEKASVFYKNFCNGTVSKAEFAQILASVLEICYSNSPSALKKKLPTYIVEAIEYVTEKMR